MTELPHHYVTTASATPDSTVTLSGNNLSDISSAPPAEFGGPGNLWSPETLLCSAVADCFTLTFRAIAAASKLDWQNLEVEVTGTLDKVERVMRFTEVIVKAHLTISNEDDRAKAERMLEKAEAGCLVSNSLSAQRHLHATIDAA